MSVLELTVPQAARIMREATKDKSYRVYPLGEEAGHYLRQKRKRLTAPSYRDYESCLDKLARHFCDLELKDFEPPVGTQRLEEFLDERWGAGAPRTYNKNLSILGDFFKWAVLKRRLHGDPTLPIGRAKTREVYRTTFTDDTRVAIVANGPSADHPIRDRLCLRLLLDFGLRKGALRAIQFKHFDHQRKRLTIFTKGQTVREVPIPSAAFWDDLGRHIIETEAEPTHFLLCRQKTIPNKGVSVLHQFPGQPMGEHGAHDWWYGCLQRAGIVETGVTSGERMHKARHTAGQRVLDRTRGNIKAAQKLLGHADPGTTMQHYVDWDIDQLAETMAEVLDED